MRPSGASEISLSFSARRVWASEQSISYLMQQGIENPDVLSLAAGFVDPHTLPVEMVRLAAHEVLSQQATGRSALQYGTTAGSETLRRTLLQHLADLEQTSVQNLGIGPQDVILTTGSQQLLSLLAEVLIDPGDIVLVAAPTYFVFLGTLAGVGARVVGVDSDAEGMRPEALEQTLRDLEQAGDLPRVKLIYVVSYYENPTGSTLATDRRRRVVELAQSWSREQRILVLEDAAYRELRYDGPEYPSLWSFDRDRNTVILAQTFSKSFCPGLRTGYGIVPRELMPALLDRKGNEDFGSGHFAQSVLSVVLRNGLLEQHLETLRSAYRLKRDAMLAALDREFSSLPGVHWEVPHGGLYVWLTLPEGTETGFDSELFQVAVHQEKMMYVPGELFYPSDSPTRRNTQMRLSFGVLDAPTLDAGICRLARSVRQVLG